MKNRFTRQTSNAIVLMKPNGERYVFIFDDDNRDETARQSGRFAANPLLSFNWYDCAAMADELRKVEA